VIFIGDKDQFFFNQKQLGVVYLKQTKKSLPGLP
jgi:hypothetical protein